MRRYRSVVILMPAGLARQGEDAGVTGLFAPQVHRPPFVTLAIAQAFHQA